MTPHQVGDARKRSSATAADRFESALEYLAMRAMAGVDSKEAGRVREAVDDIRAAAQGGQP